MIGTSVNSVNDIQSASPVSLCEASSAAAHAAKSLQVNRLCRVLVCSKDAAEMLAPFVFGESRTR
jgi:hypothetical protein